MTVFGIRKTKNCKDKKRQSQKQTELFPIVKTHVETITGLDITQDLLKTRCFKFNPFIILRNQIVILKINDAFWINFKLNFRRAEETSIPELCLRKPK